MIGNAIRRGLAGAALALLGMGVALAEEPFAPFMTPQQEIKVGQEEHPKILAQFGGVYEDPDVGGYVAVIGGRLVANTGYKRHSFTFTVLNSPIINAFALPGGYVYVTRGLLALANSEAQLAGVLAHEIGHVTARHAAQRYSRAVIAGLGTALLGVITGSDTLTQAAGLGSQLYLSGNSREHEYEADLLGVKYMARTGYRPHAQADFLASLDAENRLQKSLAGQNGRGTGFDFFATHPRTPDRVEAAIKAASETNAAANAPERREEYLRAMDGLLFGDDPEQGFVRGRVFAHTGLGFTFRAPDGFTLFNSSEAVVARSTQGGVLRFDGERRRATETIDVYLTRGWGRDIGLSNVRRFNLNGMDAASGAARVNGPDGPLDLWLVAVRYSPQQIYRFLFAAAPQQSEALRRPFEDAVFSFRRMSAAEAAGYKPKKLRMVRVGSGDTIESLSRYMALPDHGREWFMTLNALDDRSRLQPGQIVKLVQE